MADDRDLKMRCLELAERLVGHANRDVAEVVRIANTLFASLPPGVDASKTQQAMHKQIGRESRGPEPSTKLKADPLRPAGQVRKEPGTS
jgi:hypothetical protein